MKLIPIIILLSGHFGFSQIDTIRVDVKDMSINFETCQCILFEGCKTVEYPIARKWNHSDSLFISNKDTIYVYLSENGSLKIEGKKNTKKWSGRGDYVLRAKC